MTNNIIERMCRPGSQTIVARRTSSLSPTVKSYAQSALNLALYGAIYFGAHVYHHVFKQTKLIEAKSPSQFNKKSVVVITGM